jgi:hypothetical protein
MQTIIKFHLKGIMKNKGTSVTATDGLSNIKQTFNFMQLSENSSDDSAQVSVIHECSSSGAITNRRI